MNDIEFVNEAIRLLRNFVNDVDAMRAETPEYYLDVAEELDVGDHWFGPFGLIDVEEDKIQWPNLSIMANEAKKLLNSIP